MNRARLAFVLVLCFCGAVPGPAVPEAQQSQDSEKDRKPKVNLRSTPLISFSPARVSFTAELRGGADDYEDFYCPTVEWDWGDGMQSEATQDCEPYEAGKSGIRRFYTAAHVFEYSGRYTVVFRLKRNKKVVLGTNIVVQVRPGLRDPAGD